MDGAKRNITEVPMAQRVLSCIPLLCFLIIIVFLPPNVSCSVLGGKFFGSSGIWSDKVSLLHINVTQRGGEHGGESRQYHGGAEGTKSDRAVVYVLLITLVINILRNLAKPLLCNEVEQSINKTRKYPLFLHTHQRCLCA